MVTKRPLSNTLFLAGCLAGLGFFALGVMSDARGVSAAPHSDGKIFAVYSVTFNGISLGKFKFRSDISEKRYAMNGNSKFSFLSGLLFEWKGSIHSSGALKKKGPSPDTFSYVSTTNGKVETLSMKLAKNAVTKVVKSPNKGPSSKAVPVLDSHLKNVVDPMSALLVLTSLNGNKASGQKVCDRHIPVFDGKQRFNLDFSFKRLEQLNKSSHNGFSGKAYVCKVKYRPLAGHKPSKSGTKFLTETNDIEVWLVPVPKAKMFVPYQIVMPTIAGYAKATSSVFQIDQPGAPRIALTN